MEACGSDWVVERAGSLKESGFRVLEFRVKGLTI